MEYIFVMNQSNPLTRICSRGITGMRETRVAKVPRYVALSNSLERSEDLGIFATLISHARKSLLDISADHIYSG